MVDLKKLSKETSTTMLVETEKSMSSTVDIWLVGIAVLLTAEVAALAAVFIVK